MTAEPDPDADTGDESGSSDSSDRHNVPIEGIQTYLSCPRQYEYEHVYRLTADDENPETDRLHLLRRAICAALRAGDVETLEERALEEFETQWDDYAEEVHSPTQRRHERRVLEATIRAYADAVGCDHAKGLYATRATGITGELVGPDLPVTATVSAPRAGGENVVDLDIDATIDYAFLEGSSFVGVRFVATPDHLGLARYRDSWEGDIEDAFADHVDPESDRFEPRLVSTLFETATVLEGLRTLRDRLGLEDARTCRYVQIPLLDRGGLSVNWHRDRVETTLEAIDLTDRYLDHDTFGMTLEHRNRTVDGRLKRVAAAAATGPYETTERWEQIERHACPTCPYTVCCPEYLSSEVSFDG
ncbi:hypothetical protein ACLI4Q_04905 [Natrialbaceae archaeon A-CW1-1]